jgi:hypothetical protein
VHDLFLQSFILGVERVGSCVIRYNLDEYMHSVCFCFGWLFFLVIALPCMFVVCLRERNSKDSFIHSVCCGFCGSTNCYVTMIE